MAPRQELQDTGHLSEEIGLLQGELTVPGFSTRRLPQPTELVLPRPSHRLSRKGFGAEDQACSWHEGIEQIGAGLQQRRNRIGQNGPQTSGMLGRQSRRSPLRLDVAAEQLQDLAEGQIRVTDAGDGADAGDGIAATCGNHQVGVCFHRLAGKFTQQGCLAAPRLAGHEGHPSRAGQRPAKGKLPTEPIDPRARRKAGLRKQVR